METKCCGTCKWHERDGLGGDFVCVNADSEYCFDWTDYGHFCDEWEER